jgi:hypothetical protein
MFNKHRKNAPPLTRLALVGAIAASILPTLCGPVWAAYLSNWRFDPQRRQLQFTLPPGASPTYSVTREPAPRLIVNISDTQVGTNVTELYPDGAVRKVSLKEIGPEQARIIIEFAPDVVLSPDLVQLQRVGSDNSWLLRPLIARSTGESLPLSQLNPNLEVRGTRSPLFELPPESNQEVVVLESSDRPVEITVPRVEETVTEPPFPSREPQELANIDFGQPLPPSGNQGPVQFEQPLPLPVNQGPVQFEQPLPLPVNQGPVQFEQPRSTYGNRGTIRWPEPLPRSPLERSLLVLEEGETLELVFPRGENIVLPRGIELQEVLLLRSPILDRFGRIVVPAKTPVIGGFESSRNGSRFIARALYFYGRTIPLAGRSDIIEGSRRVDARILAGASAAGGLALLLLTDSGLGLLGGAAAGAGAVYATSPKAVTLEPAEVVEIRLTDDLPQSVFLGNR